MANNTFGAFDLLKTLTSHPSQDYGRHNRWVLLGLVNEPCFEKATSPDPDHWGLWLDRCGRTVRPTPSPTKRNTPGSRSAPAAR